MSLINPVPVWIDKSSWIKLWNTYPWKTEAIIRDNYKCRDCGNGHLKLIVHHIDESRTSGNLNNNLDNLVTLCRTCHSKRHGFTKTNKPIYDRLEELSKDGFLVRGVAKIVGDEFGISRERVRQLANKMGFKTANNENNPNLFNKCKICGNLFKKSMNSAMYCSVKCRKINNESYWTTVKCKECNKDIRILKSRINLGIQPTFCGKRCQGKNLAKTSGFSIHPENAGASRFKIEKSDLLEKFSLDNFTCDQFARIFNFNSPSAAYNYLKILDYRGLVKIVGKSNKRGKPSLYQVV